MCENCQRTSDSKNRYIPWEREGKRKREMSKQLLKKLPLWDRAN